ncbi:diguanylate cyclase [Arcobacter sp. FWKO B]|uniref:diguanylate cyclase n=1 Tax=Arcobacter sp. FWKO B TaxID=2593672 RepID=UPI0019068141|nr:diguanylate cyclase [Arcobacter sp. FWKO B]
MKKILVIFVVFLFCIDTIFGSTKLSNTLSSQIEIVQYPSVKIGILANRGKQIDYLDYEIMINHLNKEITEYTFEIIPLAFEDLVHAITTKSVDFLITNPSIYVEFEHKYNVSRIATLENILLKNYTSSQFGSVVFTTKDNKIINKPKDLINKTLAVVDIQSFGGYICARYEFMKFGVDISKESKLIFTTTHDGVVNMVLDKKVDAGIVRTDILERMCFEGKIDLDDIKIINKKAYENFPYLCSTELYPEWAFSKLAHTSLDLSKKVLHTLLRVDGENITSKWTIPLDYSSIHKVHKELNIPPYEIVQITPEDIFQQYKVTLLVLFISGVVILILLFMLYFMNRRLKIKNERIEKFNDKLDSIVKEKISELNETNKRLKELVNKDQLTQIASRRFFYEQVEKYFYMARRNNTPLCILNLDIDYFKVVNDTYGHGVGDQVLKMFSYTISKRLRLSDLFGRVGGEEFYICAQNTDIDEAIILANRIKQAVEEAYYEHKGEKIQITTSIGISKLLDDDTTIEEVIKRSDIALYRAKHNGRNRVEVV